MFDSSTVDNRATATASQVQTKPLAVLPEHLRNIKGPPKQLYVRSHTPQAFDDMMGRTRVAIVGSRKLSPYGEIVTRRFAGELAAQGVVIVSGLAYGIDAIAHRAALEVGGLTFAVLPSPVETVYPTAHRPLAGQILDSGGALVSEYPAGTPGYKQNFVARNRIVTGLSSALLITEATENSGTMHTARFALEQGITVMAVPGDITSPTSAGTNNLIKAGATPITGLSDLLYALSLQHTDGQLVDGTPLQSRLRGSNQFEQSIIDLLERGVHDGNQLLTDSGLAIDQFNHHLTMLEITAKVRPLGANQWALGS